MTKYSESLSAARRANAESKRPASKIMTAAEAIALRDAHRCERSAKTGRCFTCSRRMLLSVEVDGIVR